MLFTVPSPRSNQAQQAEGGDGEVSHVADHGGERLAPESVCCDAFQVPKLPQLACGEPCDNIVNYSARNLLLLGFIY